jgi:hypothetical protein
MRNGQCRRQRCHGRDGGQGGQGGGKASDGGKHVGDSLRKLFVAKNSDDAACLFSRQYQKGNFREIFSRQTGNQ